jgi:hypothetical protein
MKIYRCVKSNIVTQKFGEKNTSPELLPLYKSFNLKGHDGWDYIVSCQDRSIKTGGQCEPVFCDIDGYATITYIQKDIKAGFGINAVDQDGIHRHCWWHFDSINPELKVGDRIEGGTLLGISGNTGYSTGAHLHRGLYEYGQEGNGYNGAIDIEPYYQPIFVKDFIDTLKTQISLLQKLLEALKQLFNK